MRHELSYYSVQFFAMLRQFSDSGRTYGLFYVIEMETAKCWYLCASVSLFKKYTNPTETIKFPGFPARDIVALRSVTLIAVADEYIGLPLACMHSVGSASCRPMQCIWLWSDDTRSTKDEYVYGVSHCNWWNRYLSSSIDCATSWHVPNKRTDTSASDDWWDNAWMHQQFV